MRVHDLDLVAFEHRYIDELARFIATVMLDNEESRRRDFEHEGQCWNSARCPPHAQLVSVAPDAQMYPRPLDCERNSRKGVRIQWKRSLEYERIHSLFGRDERQ